MWAIIGSGVLSYALEQQGDLWNSGLMAGIALALTLKALDDWAGAKE